MIYYADMKKKGTGFTLMEVLIVIASIAILSTLVIVAVNPARSLAKARNGQRYADISAILSALYQYQLDNNGTLPPEVSLSEREICNTGKNCDDDVNMINLHALTDNQRYMVSIPKDPTASTEKGSGYTIF